uniref:Reverse transcriptase zinc-binding domain-containing protein n=1 Tax=Lactuca sativa TaxID=4236 RepID=A0A9R1VFI5_LACSA|nr:hypothetical protein LSAT_V11C500237940 [Lactuca sativa]
MERVIGSSSFDGVSLYPYLVGSTRSYIDGLYLPASSVPTRWVRILPIKINVFAWRLSLDKLPNRVILDSRGLDVPFLLCHICEKDLETGSHLCF